MSFVEGKELINIFRLLNESSLPYILMRNINNELPSSLEVGKDIDILINKSDEKEFINLDNEVIDKDNNLKKFILSKDISDHHYDKNTYSELIIKHLKGYL